MDQGQRQQGLHQGLPQGLSHEPADGVHANTYTTSAVLRLAFAHVLRRPGRCADASVQEAGKDAHVQAKAVVAQLLREMQDKRIQEVVDNLHSEALAGRCQPFVVVTRQWDETPSKLSFGFLRERLVQWVLDRLERQGFLKDLSPRHRAAFQKRVKGLRSGIMSVLAQRASFRWSADERSAVVVPPTIVQRNTADCLSTALGTTMPPALSWSGLASLSMHVRFVVLVLLKDSASANLALSRRVAAALPANTLVLSPRCSIHQVFRVTLGVLDQAGVVGPMHALSHLLRIADYWTKLLLAMCMTISSDLVVIQGMPPPGGQAARFAEAVLDVTLWRDSSTRARANRHHLAHGTAGRGDAARHRVQAAILQMANGDWTSGTPIHYCPLGCCSSRQESVVKFCEAALGLSMPALPPVPSMNRWNTVSANMGWWACGLVVHNLLGKAFNLMVRGLPRNVTAAMGVDLGMDQGAEEADADFHSMVGVRLGKGARFLDDRNANFRILLASAILMPVDAFVQLLSSTSVEGGRANTKAPLFGDLVDASGGVMSDVQIGLAGHLHHGSIVHTLVEGIVCSTSSGWTHFSMDVLRMVLALAAGLFARMEVPFLGYPYKLFRMVAANKTPAQRQRLASEIWTDPPCCRDQFFTGRLLAKLHCAEHLLDEGILNMLTASMQDSDVHIANLERDHAKFKRISSRNQRKNTTVERAVYEAALLRWQAEHGRAHNTLAEKHLANCGLQLMRRAKRLRRRTSARSSARRGVGGNVLVFYINTRISELRFGSGSGGGGGPRPKTPAKSQLAAEFRALTPESRAHWSALWREARLAARAPAAHQPPAVVSNKHGLWGLGDVRWPLAQTALEEALAGHGLRRAASTFRNRARQTMLVDGATGDEPGGQQRDEQHQRPCAEVHPGLCRSRDSAILEQALKLVRGLEQRAPFPFADCFMELTCTMRGGVPAPPAVYIVMASRRVGGHPSVALLLTPAADQPEDEPMLLHIFQDGRFNMKTAPALVRQLLVHGDVADVWATNLVARALVCWSVSPSPSVASVRAVAFGGRALARRGAGHSVLGGAALTRFSERSAACALCYHFA